ncbi:MAG TPA: hypothetical protein VFR08_01545, partial [Candidatus Angelobacter sp.]|nr:hypothetical protein [Candidatus Angelobacter sp.]
RSSGPQSAPAEMPLSSIQGLLCFALTLSLRPSALAPRFTLPEFFFAWPIPFSGSVWLIASC